MKKLGQCRISADHYQLYILDSAADMFEDMPPWSRESVARGLIAKQDVIGIGTKADLNDHWVEVWSSDSAPDTSGFDRAIVADLLVPSGRLDIRGLADGPEDVCRIDVPPGTYAVHVLAASLGIDQFTADGVSDEDDEGLSDREIESRLDLERYAVVLVPGVGGDAR